MGKENRSCREFMEKYKDAIVNCGTCVKFDRIVRRCKDEAGVVKRYEDTLDFEEYKKMMEDAKDIRIE